MKYVSFVNELKSKGVVFVNRKNHVRLYLNGKSSTLKRHPTQEISNVYADLVRKQLGLK